MRFETLETVFRALRDADVRYVVAGGVAVNAHGYQRMTQDLDLVVELDSANVLAALEALADLGYRPVLPVSAEDFADPETRRGWIEERNMEVFSMTSDEHPDLTVDVFAHIPFDFSEEHARAMVAEVAPGLHVRFVRLPKLIAMKRQTGRPRDLDDARHLEEILDERGQKERDDA